MNKFKSTVIIPAAGKGKRMNQKISKQYIELNNKPILVHTLEVFEKCSAIDDIILVVGKGEIEYNKEEVIKKYNFNKVLHVLEGGVERQDSVYEGIKKVPSDTDVVLVHDAARPFVQTKHIEKTIESAIIHEACVLGVRTKDTIKKVDDNSYVEDTPNREYLWLVQTPQVFKKDLIVKVYNEAMLDGYKATDDSMLVEKYAGIKVKMVEGDYANIKITTEEDLIIGHSLLSRFL